MRGVHVPLFMYMHAQINEHIHCIVMITLLRPSTPKYIRTQLDMEVPIAMIVSLICSLSTKEIYDF